MKYKDDLPLLINNSLCTLKGKCHEIFASGFFIISPKPLNITLGSIRFFSKIRGDTRKKVSHNDTSGAPWAANISENFRKKIETTLMVYSRAWRKLILEKNQSRKFRGTVPSCSRPSFLAEAQDLVSLLLFTIYRNGGERRQSFRGLTTAPSHISYWLIYVYVFQQPMRNRTCQPTNTYSLCVHMCRVSFIDNKSESERKCMSFYAVNIFCNHEVTGYCREII